MLREIGDSVKKHGITVKSPRPPKPETPEDLTPKRDPIKDIKKVIYTRAAPKYDSNENRNPLLGKRNPNQSQSPRLEMISNHPSALSSQKGFSEVPKTQPIDV